MRRPDRGSDIVSIGELESAIGHGAHFKFDQGMTGKAAVDEPRGRCRTTKQDQVLDVDNSQRTLLDTSLRAAPST